MKNKLAWIYNYCGTTNKQTRDKWIADKLKEIPKGKRILDAGAGEQPYRKYCTHLNYTSQDFAQYIPKVDTSGLHRDKFDYSSIDIVSEITSIPVDDASFDVVLCSEVLEHLSDPQNAIKEFSRIIKPDGILLITVPVSSITHMAPYYFYNGFSRYFFEKFINKKEFDISELTYNGSYFEYLAQEIQRVPFVCKRYSGFGFLLKVIYYIFAIPLLIFISLASKRDKGSNELLSYGILIKAQKKHIL